MSWTAWTALGSDTFLHVCELLHGTTANDVTLCLSALRHIFRCHICACPHSCFVMPRLSATHATLILFKETTDADIEKLQAAVQAGLMPMPPVPGHASDDQDTDKPPTGLLDKPTLELLPGH